MWLARAKRLVLTLLAMMGWRIEHLNLAWLAGGLASLALAQGLMKLADERLIVAYFLATLVFYYGGNWILLVSRFPARTIARLGEERAFRLYETILGLMFLNQGLGVGAMATLHWPRYEGLTPAPVLLAAGIALFAVGALVKLWATLTVGVDAYYFRDMFLGRPLAPESVGGPYRFIRNPMYSVGQLQGYGYALLYASLPGVLAAAAGQALIYVFFFAAERPFLKRVYGEPIVQPRTPV